MNTALLIVALVLAAPSPGIERRCGWLHNPTPANWWLVDNDGEWLIGAQGGYQAPGMDRMPDMTTLGWVRTNGNYGHGCACMDVAVDRASRRVTRIEMARPQPLRDCRTDPHLPPM
jgi:hypothetical protein